MHTRLRFRDRCPAKRGGQERTDLCPQPAVFEGFECPRKRAARYTRSATGRPSARATYSSRAVQAAVDSLACWLSCLKPIRFVRSVPHKAARCANAETALFPCNSLACPRHQRPPSAFWQSKSNCRRSQEPGTHLVLELASDVAGARLRVKRCSRVRRLEYGRQLISPVGFSGEWSETRWPQCAWPERLNSNFLLR